MNQRILMVADSRTDEVDEMQRYLGDVRYEVEAVASMRRAIERARDWQPDLILVSAARVDCPALPMIRSLARASPVAVVFLAESEAIDFVEFLADIPCVIGVLARPVARQALLDVVRAAIVGAAERSSARGEATRAAVARA